MYITLSGSTGIVGIKSISSESPTEGTILDLSIFNPNLKIGVTLQDLILLVGDAICGYNCVDVEGGELVESQGFYSTVYQSWYAKTYMNKWGALVSTTRSKMEILSKDTGMSVPQYRDLDMLRDTNIVIDSSIESILSRIIELEGEGFLQLPNARQLLYLYGIFIQKPGLKMIQIGAMAMEKFETPEHGPDYVAMFNIVKRIVGEV